MSISIKADEKLKVGARVAIESRELSRTFGTQVGVAYETPGGWIGGFNTEEAVFNGLHGEETGLIRGYDKRRRTTDFSRMLVVYLDSATQVQEEFPACPGCWDAQLKFAHPGLELITASLEGKAVDSWKLVGEIINLKPPGVIYPSELIKKAKPLTNMEPVNGMPVDVPEYMKDKNDIEALIRTAFNATTKNVSFMNPPRPLQLFDAVAFGMVDGHTYGGFQMLTHGHKSYEPEKVGTVLALADRYNGTDFSIMLGIAPAYVPQELQVGFMATQWRTYNSIKEFATANLRITGVDTGGSRIYQGDIRDLLRRFDEAESFDKWYKEFRPRKASTPKIGQDKRVL